MAPETRKRSLSSQSHSNSDIADKVAAADDETTTDGACADHESDGEVIISQKVVDGEEIISQKVVLPESDKNFDRRFIVSTGIYFLHIYMYSI